MIMDLGTWEEPQRQTKVDQLVCLSVTLVVGDSEVN